MDFTKMTSGCQNLPPRCHPLHRHRSTVVVLSSAVAVTGAATDSTSRRPSPPPFDSASSTRHDPRSTLIPGLRPWRPCCPGIQPWRLCCPSPFPSTHAAPASDPGAHAALSCCCLPELPPASSDCRSLRKVCNPCCL
jgi:hypothetical protein